jgi:hypothetical protein
VSESGNTSGLEFCHRLRAPVPVHREGDMLKYIVIILLVALIVTDVLAIIKDRKPTGVSVISGRSSESQEYLRIKFEDRKDILNCGVLKVRSTVGKEPLVLRSCWWEESR